MARYSEADRGQPDNRQEHDDYAAEMAEMDAADCEWVKWTGGDCPLPADTPVQVKFRDGMYSVQQPGATAGYWHGNGSNFTSCWQHNAEEPHSDIVAYRVVES